MSRADPRGATTKLLPGGDGVLSLLVVAAGPPTVVALAAGRDVRIGRASTADVVVDDDSLSRHHAVFRIKDGKVEVENLSSSNGTTVRGKKIQHPTVLDVGDSAHLGAVLVVVQSRTGTVAERLRPVASAAPRDELVARIAASAMSVLVLGETGVGKEVMAERLHALSPRKNQPLVKLNCAALMTSVLESELFGYEKGSFTGAVKDKPGLIETADGGTVFLDELGEADHGIQVKLLRVLEARETQRIGALKPRIVDVRFVAATNRTPAELIDEGKLRADLYYRIAGFTITIPPLRERREQIPQLAAELLARHGKIELDPRALQRLNAHDWPGNVRELRNVLDRAVVLAGGPRVGAGDIAEAMQFDAPPAGKPRIDADPDRAHILAVLEECGGNQSIAAGRLGISRRTLVNRLSAWGLTKTRRK